MLTKDAGDARAPLLLETSASCRDRPLMDLLHDWLEAEQGETMRGEAAPAYHGKHFYSR